MAKGAIAAGIRTLLETAGISENDIDALYIAGGFGSHLSTASSAAIGLIPRELENRVAVIGNGALSGAAQLLLRQEDVCRIRELAQNSRHVNLGGSSLFNRNFMEAMLFGDNDLFD